MENVLSTAVKQKFILILDSWNGQKDDSLFEALTGSIECLRLQIPPKTTSYVQPLDVYGFRQWKTFVRRITDITELDMMDIDMNDRLNLITMHSLIYDQLSSPKFEKMWRYSWYKSGYINTHPGKFKNVVEICFSSSIDVCQENCDDIVFICCSYCEKSLCFNHFFRSYHNHIQM